jgi:hypothetical protein
VAGLGIITPLSLSLTVSFITKRPLNNDQCKENKQKKKKYNKRRRRKKNKKKINTAKKKGENG